jgi:hypothetical protein
VHAPLALPAFPRWALPKRAMVFEHAVGTRCRTAVPAIPLSMRSTHRTAVFVFLGSPCDFAHELDTALDFRSGADPCEWLALRIQN